MNSGGHGVHLVNKTDHPHLSHQQEDMIKGLKPKGTKELILTEDRHEAGHHAVTLRALDKERAELWTCSVVGRDLEEVLSRLRREECQ